MCRQGGQEENELQKQGGSGGGLRGPRGRRDAQLSRRSMQLHASPSNKPILRVRGPLPLAPSRFLSLPSRLLALFLRLPNPPPQFSNATPTLSLPPSVNDLRGNAPTTLSHPPLLSLALRAARPPCSLLAVPLGRSAVCLHRCRTFNRDRFAPRQRHTRVRGHHPRPGSRLALADPPMPPSATTISARPAEKPARGTPRGHGGGCVSSGRQGQCVASSKF